MRGLAIWLLLAGCGRLHFGPLAGGDASLDSDGDAAADATAVASELCNGIDDDANGLVDEGCSCTPFSMSYGSVFLLPTIVSSGTDWYALDATGIVRFDGTTGAVVGHFPPASGDGLNKQGLAWDGSHVVIYDASGVLEFLDPSGAIVATGPPTGITGDGVAVMAWNGSGFDVAVTPTQPAPNHIMYVRTDATGAPITAVATSVATVTAIFGEWIGLRDGAPFLVLAIDESAGNHASVSSPVPPTLTWPGNFGSTEPSDAATDGTRAIIVGDGNWLIDDNGLQGLSLGGLTPTSVTWTGTGFELVYIDTTGGIAKAMVAKLDSALNVQSAVPAISIPYSSSVFPNNPVIVSDARRTLVAWMVGVDGNPEMAYLAQLCP